MKPTKEEIQEVADYINGLNPLIAMGYKFQATLEATLKSMKKQKSDVVSAAALIGQDYEIKEKDLDFRIKRMEALINLIKAYKEGDKAMGEIAEMKSNMNKINHMFGL